MAAWESKATFKPGVRDLQCHTEMVDMGALDAGSGSHKEGKEKEKKGGGDRATTTNRTHTTAMGLPCCHSRVRAAWILRRLFKERGGEDEEVIEMPWQGVTGSPMSHPFSW
jgi:hypothetical protein